MATVRVRRWRRCGYADGDGAGTPMATVPGPPRASVPTCRGDGAGHAWDGGAGYAEGGGAGWCRAEPLAVRPIALDPVPQAVYCSVT
jgi:hypothetical protein